MAEREKYYIALDGQTFEVSRELYEAYYKGHRKEKYFTVRRYLEQAHPGHHHIRHHVRQGRFYPF